MGYVDTPNRLGNIMRVATRFETVLSCSSEHVLCLLGVFSVLFWACMLLACSGFGRGVI